MRSRAIVTLTLKTINGRSVFHQVEQHAYDASGTKYDVSTSTEDSIDPNEALTDRKTYNDGLVFDIPALHGRAGTGHSCRCDATASALES